MARSTEQRKVGAGLVAAAAMAVACAGGGGTGQASRSTRIIPPADVADLATPPPGDPVGRRADRKAVYLFSQVETSQRDPQVLQFADAVLIRAWQKWDTHGQRAADYDFGYADAGRARGIAFVAGGTASVLFQDEDPDHFLDWATRDAQGALVEHAYIVPGAHRASLANPGYRAHVLEYCKKQIDGGVDGVFLDEFNGGGYNGGARWGWNGNEGYDDWFLAGFNAWLLARHPGFTEADFISTYGMTPDNVVRPGVPPGDLGRSFDYRFYLQRHGWDAYPADPRNPLAPVYGQLTGNRPAPAADAFRERAMLWYWRQVVAELREYARARYGKEILVTSNGIFPWVDFNSLGLYEGNRDDDGREAQWVPLAGGHLDGARSLKPLYRKVRARSQAVSGDVPLVLFLDWPTRTIDGYYGLSLQEKKDFWRIFAAEAYANGLFYAFHLRTSMPDEPSATQSGVLEFLEAYAAFYEANAAVYTGAAPADVEPAVSVPHVAATVSAGGGKTFLHLVNHAYAGGLVAQEAFTVTFPLAGTPTAAVLRTPDAPGERSLPLATAGGNVTVTVDRLESYDLVELR